MKPLNSKERALIDAIQDKIIFYNTSNAETIKVLYRLFKVYLNKYKKENNNNKF